MSTHPTGRQGRRSRRYYYSRTGIVFAVSAIVLMLAYTTSVRADKPGAANTDPRLAGIWKIDSGVNNGEPIPAEELEGVRTIVRENAISSYDRDEKIKFRCIYTFDSSKDPNTIDMVSTMPNNQDAKAMGIYKIEGDAWTLCYSVGGGERPEKFESPKGSKLMLLKMTRLDKGDAETE